MSVVRKKRTKSELTAELKRKVEEGAQAAAAAKRAKFSVDALAHLRQLQIIRSPHRRKVVRTSRRFGKTILGVLALLETALARDGSISLFVAKTRIYAKQLAWDLLKSYVREYALTDADLINETELTIRFQNGAMIQLVGGNTDDEILKIKGRKYALVVVDEAQIFPAYLRTLIDEVLETAVLNAQGTIIVLGTPPPSIVGPFVDLLNSPAWEHHHGTARENPFFEREAGMTFEAAREDFIRRRKCKPDDPTLLREFDGELVTDTDALAVRVPEHAIYDQLPTDAINYVLGVDIGWSDATVIAPERWGLDGVVYLDREDAARHQTGQTLAGKLAVYASPPPLEVAVDTSGNRIAFETLKTDLQRQGVYLPLEPRKVMPVESQIGIINVALAEGRLKVRRDSRFFQDAQLVVWRDGVVGSALAGLHSDSIPAAIYAYCAAIRHLPPLAPKADQQQDDLAALRRRLEIIRAQEAAAQSGYDPSEFDTSTEYDDCR